MEKWIEIRKGGNFMEMAKKYGIDPLIARIIRNRDIIDEKRNYRIFVWWKRGIT